MIDALGFKGIWRRSGNTSEAVLNKLQALSDALERQLDAAFNGQRNHRLNVDKDANNFLDYVRCAFLSDTVVIGVAPKPDLVWTDPRDQMVDLPPPPKLDPFCISLLSVQVSGALRLAAESTPVLAYRGAISYGEFQVGHDGRFIVGPAVDDSAENCEIAQGAFVWMTPKGMRAFLVDSVGQPTAKPFAPLMGLVPYSVPLKGGLSFDTFVVSPFHGCQSREECGNLRDLIMRSFEGGNLDVEVKRQQTSKFLDAAMQAWTPPGG